MAFPCGRDSSTGDAGCHGNNGTSCFLVFCGCVSGSLNEGKLGMWDKVIFLIGNFPILFLWYWTKRPPNL